MRVLAITHGPSVGAGVFADAVRGAGHDLVEWCVPVAGEQPPVGDPGAVIVLGGGMHADQEELHPWLVPELRFIERELERGTPLLGVCLGAQLVARAAGGRVFRAPAPEIGWYEVELTEAGRADAVLSSTPPRFDAFQWHHYTWALPAAAELARGGGLSQAYRLGERAWGVQFHPEITAPQIEAWIADAPGDVGDAAALRATTRERIAGWNRLGRELCGAFLAAASTEDA